MIKYLVMDVDGTLTDGRIYLFNDGNEAKAFNVKDGLGIVKAMKAGITPIILTGRHSKIVELRAEELGIKHVYQGIDNKVEKLNALIEELKINKKDIAYIGDDENDREVMELCALIGCPLDAVSAVKDISHFVSSSQGGKGAVRDFIEHILRQY